MRRTVLAGKDLAVLVERYPGRTLASHFKAKLPEGVRGAPRMKPIIGQDRTDRQAVHAAARGPGGAEWSVLEQEEYPDGMRPLEAVAASMCSLRAVVGDRESQTN